MCLCVVVCVCGVYVCLCSVFVVYWYVCLCTCVFGNKQQTQKMFQHAIMVVDQLLAQNILQIHPWEFILEHLVIQIDAAETQGVDKQHDQCLLAYKLVCPGRRLCENDLLSSRRQN